MFNKVEKEVSEIIYKDPYKCCIMCIHLTPDKNDIYTIFIRGDIIAEDSYIKDQTEYDACRISLTKSEYIDLGYNIELTQDEKIRFNEIMHSSWDIVNQLKDDNIKLGECPDYTNL